MSSEQKTEGQTLVIPESVQIPSTRDFKEFAVKSATSLSANCVGCRPCAKCGGCSGCRPCKEQPITAEKPDAELTQKAA